MSRGRGFRSRGSGGGGRGKRLGGAEVPWAYDPDLKPDNAPSELFPPYDVPITKPPSRVERAQVGRYRSLRDRIHEGPLYTVLGDDARVSKSGASGSKMVDPFEGMPTYSQKYKKKTRRVPRLDTRPYVLRFFPKELWSTLNPDHETTDDPTTLLKKKTLRIAMAEDLDDGGVPLDLEALEQLENPAAHAAQPRGEDEEDDVLLGDDGGDEEEEKDVDYESDEDETAGDYHAETYFDDGADDDRDDHDAGEDHDGDF
ncbi:MAG: hypothetical protein M1838_004288 [Thelocarpon superellum]|nr:MAG: hypothetical protein M1838_004288 [Thelocarpon superellum]